MALETRTKEQITPGNRARDTVRLLPRRDKLEPTTWAGPASIRAAGEKAMGIAEEAEKALDALRQKPPASKDSEAIGWTRMVGHGV